MSVYLCFAGFDYYPGGGMHDLVGVFEADSDADAVRVWEGFNPELEQYANHPEQADWRQLVRLDPGDPPTATMIAADEAGSALSGLPRVRCEPQSNRVVGLEVEEPS